MLDGGGGGGGMAPFDRHQADTGLLADAAAQLDRIAGLAINEHLTGTLRAFDPAVHSWDGVAAPELRQAGEDVAERAVVTSGAVAWGAVPVRYWVERVNAFNTRVDELIVTREGLAATDYGATGTGGQPPTAEQIGDARAEAMAPLYDAWWRAYNDEILDGAATTATMYRDGPTAENLAEARAADVIPLAGGALNVFTALWHEQAMRAGAAEAAELAERIRERGDAPPSQRDLERLNELLDAYAGDPAFAYHLLTALGPRGLLDLTGDVALVQEPGMLDGDLASLVGSIQGGLALALATGTRRAGITHEHGEYVRGNYELPPSWVDDLIGLGDEHIQIGYGHTSQTVYGFQLLGVLVSAETADYPPTAAPVNFEPEFLARVGGEMLDFELAHGGAQVWPGLDPSGSTGSHRLNWINGHSDTAPAGYDPLGSVMTALGNNREAAVQFFSEPATSPDGGGVSRVRYLVTERTWPYDVPFVGGEPAVPAGVVHLGSALEATTADLDDNRAEGIVRRMVVAVGEDGVVHEYLYQPVADVAAHWIGSMYEAIEGRDELATDLTSGQAGAFLREIGRDEYAHRTVAVAAGTYGMERLSDRFGQVDWSAEDASEDLRDDRDQALNEARELALPVAEILYQVDMGRNDDAVDVNSRRVQVVENITTATRAALELGGTRGAGLGVALDLTGVQGAIVDAYDDSERIAREHGEAQATSMDVLEGLYWSALLANGGPGSGGEASGYDNSDRYDNVANDVATTYADAAQPGDL